MRGGKLPTITEIPAEILGPYRSGEIGYREAARRMGVPRNTMLRALARLGHTARRQAVDMQGKAVRERWVAVPIEEYRDYYSVSNRGRVRRDRKGVGSTGGILRPSIVNGHPAVNLSAPGAGRNLRTIAPLVMRAFGSKPPGPGYLVAHRDGSLENCNIWNLEWKSVSEVQKPGRPHRKPAGIARPKGDA
jgi:hypothetical protein